MPLTRLVDTKLEPLTSQYAGVIAWSDGMRKTLIQGSDLESRLLQLWEEESVEFRGLRRVVQQGYVYVTICYTLLHFCYIIFVPRNRYVPTEEEKAILRMDSTYISYDACTHNGVFFKTKRAHKKNARTDLSGVMLPWESEDGTQRYMYGVLMDVIEHRLCAGMPPGVFTLCT